MPMKPPMGPGRAVPHPWPTRPRIRGRRLLRLRDQLLASQPCCAHCGRILMPDRWVRDHVVPLAEGGQDVLSNTQALCLDCHDAKTQAETRRGQMRRHG